MKTKLLGKRTVVAALLAAVFLVSTAFFAVFAFRGNRVFAEGTYYTDDVSAMPEIDFSETGLVSDAKSETFDNAGVLQEIWGENAPGMTVDTTMTASFMFESGANTGYVVSFRRSGWSEDLKLNFYPDGKVELFKNRSESQSFNDGAFQAGTWYYVKYTVATLYSDEALETQVGYRSTYTVTDNAEYTFSHSMDFLNEEIGNDESGSAIKYDTGNFFLWVSTELANHVHVASYQYDPSSVPEEPTDPVDPEACYTKDIASLPAIDFSATGLVMDPKADTYNESGLKEFYEGNAPGTTIDTTFTAAIMFEEGAVNTHPISFRRSGWSENLKLNIYSDGKVELYKNDTPADCETFNGTAFTSGTWYYVKYTVANLYSDEGLKNQVGYRSVVTITDNADYNVEYTLSFLNEETNGLDYNTGNFFVWMGTELGGKGYIASYQFDPDAEATTYYPAVDLEDAEVIEISDKIPMNAAGIDIRSDSYFSNDGYYANFTGVYELNKTFRFRIQGKGSFHTAYTGNWIWESYKADFEYDTNSIIFGRGGDDRGDTINPSPALSEDKIYLVEITIIEYLREDNDEKAFEMMKQGVRVFNCARGGIIKESALIEALKSGKVAAAGLDVYEKEPLTKDSPLLGFPNLVLTPHLGASTKEATECCGIEVAEVIAEALSGGAIRNSINKPSVDAESMKQISPYVELCEKLGTFIQQISAERIEKLVIRYYGKLANLDNKLLTLAVQKGYLSKIAERANDLNAPSKMKHLGIQVESVNSSADSDYAELVEVEACCEKGTCNTVAGTIMGKKSRPKIVRIGPNNVEVNAAAKCAILLKNVDKPGMVGVIGTILGENGCNIANMTLSRDDDGGNALSIFELDAIPSAEAVAALKNHKCVQDVKVVDFSA